MQSDRRNFAGAFLHEASMLWQRAIRDGDGVRWTLVRRVRDLTGVAALETRLEQFETSVVTSGGSSSIAVSDDQARAAGTTLIDPTAVHAAPAGPPSRNSDRDEARLEDRLRVLEAAHRREIFTTWAASVPLTRTPLVTVILATLAERPVALAQALRSILSQSYAQIEVLLITPAAATIPTEFVDEPRIREVVFEHAGIGRARNAGLAAARGEFITYADDDNTMGPHWVRALVAAFQVDSSIDVVYGARLHQRSPGGVDPVTPADMGRDVPAFWWFEETWDPAVLERFNPIDTGVLAHRAGLAEARWDEELAACGDWDLAIRLTAEGRVRPLPVLACVYTVTGPGRITDQFNVTEVRAEVVRRARAARPLRLLGVTHSFPRFTEYYVESELAALGPRFEVATASEFDADQRARSNFARLGTVAVGLDAHRPDLVLVHFADVALRIRPLLAERGIPYALRVHSYDRAIASSHDFVADELCVGVWAYPEHVDAISGARPLPGLVHNLHTFPPPPMCRSGMVFTSACLPKRNWATLASILQGLDGVERSVILGTCHGHEDLVPNVVADLESTDPRIRVVCDIHHEDVIRALTFSASCLHIASSNHRMGNPRSVIEAWLCGSIPVLPESSESREFAGDYARYYSSPDDAIAIIREIEVGGDSIEKEREANFDQAVARFAAPEVLQRFSVELRAAVQRVGNCAEMTQRPDEPSPTVRPTVAIVLTVFNDGRYVDDSLGSALDLQQEAADIADVSVVVADDGSTDRRTVDVLDRCERRGSVVLRGLHRGLGATRNAALRCIRTDWFIPLDADNMLRSSILGALLSRSGSPTTALVYGDAMRFGNEHGRWRMGPTDIVRLWEENHIDSCGLIRRDAWEKVGGYAENCPGLEDWDLWLRFLEAGLDLAYVPELVFDYRVRADSLVRQPTVSRQRTPLVRRGLVTR